MRALALAVAVAALAVAAAARSRAVETLAPPARAASSDATRDAASAAASAAASDAARFAGAHLPGAAVTTARLATGAVVAVADRAPGLDRSWGSSLLYAASAADDGRAPVELCDRVFFASRPLPLPSGEVVVERGVAGAPLAGRVRVDELTLDAVDPRTRASRTLYATTGFEAYLVGLAGDELVVYLVQPGVASLRAIDWRTGTERVIVPSLAPYAHDFVVDRGTVIVHNRDPEHRERETIDRIDLGNGNLTRLETR